MGENGYSAITTETLGQVIRITLNRPDKRNAISRTMRDEVVAAAREAEQSADVRIIIIRGAGSSFSSGYDITEGNAYGTQPSVEEDIAACIDIGASWSAIWNCRIPVIAQVHGYCVAGGTDLALHCDFVVAADDAQIGFPPVRAQGGPPTHMWVYNTGPQWAKRILLSGDLISGRKAAQIGLVLESVPLGELDEYVLATARRIAQVGKGLLSHNKRVVNLAIEMMGRSQMQTVAAIHDVLGHLTPEAQGFQTAIRERGLKEAVRERDAAFET